jgi:hypothetical protein
VFCKNVTVTDAYHINTTFDPIIKMVMDAALYSFPYDLSYWFNPAMRQFFNRLFTLENGYQVSKMVYHNIPQYI